MVIQTRDVLVAINSFVAINSLELLRDMNLP